MNSYGVISETHLMYVLFSFTIKPHKLSVIYIYKNNVRFINALMIY